MPSYTNKVATPISKKNQNLIKHLIEARLQKQSTLTSDGHLEWKRAQLVWMIGQMEHHTCNTLSFQAV
jgi:hypothetical protein